MRVLKFALLFLCIAAGSFGMYVFLTREKNPSVVPNASVESAASRKVARINKNDPKPLPVTTVKVSKESVSYLNTLGTVKPKVQVRIFPQNAGQISKIYVKEGDRVKAGQLLFVIGGQNGAVHPAQTQFEIASLNHDTARKSLENTQAANSSSLATAKLQVQSAENQAQGSYIDMEIQNQGIEGIVKSLDLLEENLQITRYKNARDLERTKESIEDLESALDTLFEQKNDTIALLREQIDNAPDPVTEAKLEAELNKVRSEFDKNIDTLTSQMKGAKIGYQSLEAAAKLMENQIIAQMNQVINQSEVTELSKQSLKKKLGLANGSSDTLRFAEEGLNSTEIRGETAFTQAQAQVELTRLNLALAQSQVDALQIRAPISGIVGELMVREGDQVSPQVFLTQLTDDKNFEVKANIDISSAEKVQPDSIAQIKTGNRIIKTHVKSLSSAADPNSKLVTVTLALPRIFFRANESIEVTIPLSGISKAENFFVPLDAVIIGTEDQYVFTVKDGKAHKTQVKLGVIQGDQAEILDGVQDGTEVVLEGAKQILDGQNITLL